MKKPRNIEMLIKIDLMFQANRPGEIFGLTTSRDSVEPTRYLRCSLWHCSRLFRFQT